MRVAELLQKYFPAEDILYKIPNFKYSNHYIFHDNFMGVIASTHLDNYKNDYTHIDEHKKEDLIAMNVHQSFLDTQSEKDVAIYLKNLINNMYQYSHH